MLDRESPLGLSCWQPASGSIWKVVIIKETWNGWNG